MIWKMCLLKQFTQGCHGQGKYLENEIFSRSGNSQGFCGWSGKFRKELESQGKVREFENNGYGRQTSENLFILFTRGKDVHSHLPPHWGLLLKERICSLGEQILSFKSNPQI